MLKKRDNQVIEKLRFDLEKVNMTQKETMDHDPDYIEVIEVPDDQQEVTIITPKITPQQMETPHTRDCQVQNKITLTSQMDNNPHTGVSQPPETVQLETKTSHTGGNPCLMKPHTGENHIQCNPQKVTIPHTGDNHIQCSNHTGECYNKCINHTGKDHIKCKPHTGESKIQCQINPQPVENPHTGAITQTENSSRRETINQANALQQNVDNPHTGVNTQHKDTNIGTNQVPHVEDNPHTGVYPHLEAKPQRITTSHTGENPLNIHINSSNTGVTPPGINNTFQTGENTLPDQVINPNTGAISRGMNPHTGDIPQAGAIPHSDIDTRQDPLSDTEVASLLDGLPSTGSEIEWKYLGHNAWAVPTQYLAWIKVLKDKEGNIPIYQFEVTYKYKGIHPHGIPNYVELAGHPDPNNLHLKYSHNGEWVKVPKVKWDSSGPDYLNFHMGRLERYLDDKGNLMMAVAYGKTKDDLKSWFDYDTLRESLGNWVLPTVPYWYNNPTVIMDKVRKEHEATGVKGINNKNDNNGQNPQQNKKKEVNKQNNTQVRKKNEPVRENSQNRPPKPQRPRKDSSRDSRNPGRPYEQRRDNSNDRRNRYDGGFIRNELDDYYGEEERKYEERNRNRYRQEDRYYNDEDSPRDHQSRGRGEGQRERSDRSRNPGHYSRDNYDRTGHRDSSRESYRGDYREERRPERSPSRERERNYGASRDKTQNYGRGRGRRS